MTTYGKYTQKAIDEGCKINITTESHLENSGKIVNNRFCATVRNKSGKELVWTNSKISLDKVLDSIEEKLTEKAKRLEEATHPFAKLVAEVEHITDFVFPNNDKAKHLSRNETHNSWDIERNSENKCIIRIHNAANWVIYFDMIQIYSEIELNLRSLNTWGMNREMEALPKLLDAIREYLYIDQSIRMAEFNISMEEVK